MRPALAVLAGKATGALSRATGRGGGTTFPGDVARAIDRGVLRKLSADLTQGAVLITGTNGKTTTSRLVSALLQGLPARVVANRAGANLIYGATAAAVNRAGLDGRLRADWAVFEIDEATLPIAVEEIQPRAVLVGNLFRDQLDRYGELELLAQTIHRALERMPAGGHAVLNADDPRVGEIGLGLARPPLWYGLDDPSVSAAALPHAADARTCPRCGESLHFRQVYVGHDGAYECPNGDFARPEPDLVGTDVQLDGLDRVAVTAAETRLVVPLGGLYNVYNVLGAFAVGGALGLQPDYMADRLRTAAAAFGRQERFERDGRRFTMMLAKNPTGFNEILRESERAHGRHFLIGLNDRIADGRDVSWIWDVDFELLAGRADVIVPSGVRAHDLAVRLKYAGVDAAEPPQPDLGHAIDRLIEATPPGAEGFLLCTYTAMLDLRALLVRRGWLKPYWAT
ncbi:MAG TPA: MurT ligase domain-containing protein [Candidatus Dormibacteraeota bacterium]|nr:MurT ligase domain-containing protein [Candidatus Dormibacteraeota bacterium]